MIKYDSMFLISILLFVLIVTYNAQPADNTPARVLKPGEKCFFETVGNLITNLKRISTDFEKLCNLEKNKNLNSLFAAVKKIALLESFGNGDIIDQATNTDLDNFIKKNEAKFAFVKRIPELRDLKVKKQFDQAKAKAEEIWNGAQDKLRSIAEEKHFPVFFRHHMAYYMKFIRQLAILEKRYKGKENDCIRVNSDNIVLTLADLTFNPSDTFDPSENTCKKTDLSTIDPLDIEKGGWTYTFWMIQNLEKLKTAKTKTKLLQGFLDSQEIFTIDLSKKDINSLGVDLNFGTYSKSVIIKEECNDLAFVVISFGKDCDKYKLHISFRNLLGTSDGSNRISFDINLTDQEVEKIKIRLNKSFAIDERTFTGFYDTLNKELKLLVFSTTEARLKELSQIHNNCYKEISPCAYRVDSSCNTCQNPSKLFKGKCYSECPQDTFVYTAEDGSQSCKECDKKCKACDGPKNGQCSKCIDKYYLYNASCVDKCPVRMAPVLNKKTGVIQCKDCGNNCQECTSPTECQTCDNNWYLYNKLCVKTCPKHSTYHVVKPNECRQCPNECETCSSDKICDSCDVGFYLFDSKCIQVCPKGFMANKDTRKCNKCTANCDRCDNQAICLTCTPPYYLHKYTGKCVTKCPESTVEINGVCVSCSDKNCKECSPKNVKECKVCTSQQVLKKGLCLDKCGDKWWLNDQRECKQCTIPRCKNCTQKKCLVCDRPLFLLNGEQCVEVCPAGYAEAGDECIKCIDSINCSRCKPNDLADCKTCKKGFYIYLKNCVQKCPKKFYEDDTKGICVPCSEGCEFCNGEQCKRCDPDQYLLNGKCFKNCPEGWTSNDKHECQQCKVANCKTCQVSSLDVCELCIGKNFLYNNKCYPECPGQTFPEGRICKDCASDCLVCKSKTECENCKPPRNVFAKRCVNLCPDGFTPKNGICEQCKNKKCKRCEVQNTLICNECKENEYLQNGDCLPNCNVGWFPDKTRVCQPCQKPCVTCSVKANNCITCTNGFKLLPNKTGEKTCVDTCPDGTMPNTNTNHCDGCQDPTNCKKCSPVDNCITCKNSKKVFQKKCIDECPDGYFNNNGTCEPCLKNCKRCNNAKICTKCDKKLILYNSKKECIKECPDGWVSNGDECIKCEGACQKCNPVSTKECTKCPQRMFLFNKQCINSCPNGTMEDRENQTCIPCVTKNSKTCIDKGRTCIECELEMLLQDNECKKECSDTYCKKQRKCTKSPIPNVKKCDEDNKPIECMDGCFMVNGKFCNSNCPLGFFKNIEKKRCDACPTDCDQCNDALTCTKCNSKTYLFEKKCVKECPDTYAPLNGYCVKCDTLNCLKCPGLKICDICIEGKLLYDNKCVRNCPETYFSDGFRCKECGFKCRFCIDQDNCKECLNGWKRSKEGKCVDKCPDGFVAVGKDCEKCKGDSNCIKCPEKNLTDCDECKGKMLWDTVAKKCIDGPCPERMFQSQNKCLPCIEGCKKCLNNNTCKECQDKWFLHQNRCVPICPVTFGADKGKCNPCSAHCDDCVGNKCVTCTKPYYKHQGVCLDDCPDNFWKNSNNCDACDSRCAKCKDSKTCNKCNSPFFLKLNNCVKECGEGYRTDENTKECSHCSDSDCKICKSNTKKCDKCKGTKKLFNNKCVDECPSGTYANSNAECVSCFKDCILCKNNIICDRCKLNSFLTIDHKECRSDCMLGERKKVIGPDGKCELCKDVNCENCDFNMERCDKCKSKFFLFNNGCVHKCPKATYLDKTKTKCLPCSSPCNDCLNEKLCLVCPKGFYLQNGVCLTKCDYGYQNDNGICKPCKTKKCKICSNTDLCDKCESGYFKLTKTINKSVSVTTECVKLCPTGYSPINGECWQCTNRCIECTKQECFNCEKGLFKQDGRCVERCKEGYVPKNPLECGQCTVASCKFCDGSKLENCKECFVDTFLKVNQCVPDCGEGWYVQYLDKEKRTGICKPCGKDCKKCTDKNNCLKCAEKTVMQVGKCINECDSGYILVNAQDCKECADKNCHKCDSTLNSCLTCKKGYYRKKGICVKECGVGYFMNEVKQECEPCSDPNCILCKNQANECGACKAEWFMLNGKCVKPCPEGYTAKNNKECVSCVDVGCRTCGIDLQPCLECSFPRILFNGRCVKECDKGYYRNPNINQCKKCSDNCKECRSEATCDICNTKFYLSEGKCKDKCPDGQSPHPRTNICTPCDDDNCSKCPTLKTCTSCKTPYVLLKDKCVEKCPSDYFKTSSECQQCRTDCKECKDSNSCESCKNPKVLYNKQCIDNCPPGWTKFGTNKNVCEKCDVKNCERCDKGVKNCNKCESPFKLKGNVCYEVCPDRTFALNGECKPCSLNCNKCDNEKKCNECISPFSLFSDYCEEDCPPGFTKEKVKGNNKAFECEKCENTRCYKCKSGNSKKCTECPVDKFPFKEDCFSNCPIGYYEILEPLRECKDCSQNCIKCTDKKECKKCNENSMLSKGLCVKECPEGQTPINGVCYNCGDPHCKTCKPSDLNSCEKCDNESFLLNERCPVKCPEKTYADTKTRKCEPCGENCITCTSNKDCSKCNEGFFFWRDSVECKRCEEVIVDRKCFPCSAENCSKCKPGKPSQCETCQTGFYFHKKLCVKDCPEGFYPDGQECSPCNKNCKKCLNSKSCDECLEKFSLYLDFKCLDKCPEGMVTVNRKCMPCDEQSCKECQPLKREICEVCKEGYMRYDGKCLRICPEGTFPDGNLCKPCPKSCRRCTETTCNSCEKPFKLKGQECVQKCGEFFWDNGEECIGCNNPKCITCDPNNKCNKCQEGTFLYKNDCLDKCPEYTFARKIPKSKSSECIDCDRKCKTCDENGCKDCIRGFNLIKENHECSNKCPIGSTSVNGVCTPCENKNCLQCEPEAPSKCSYCLNKMLLYNKECVNSCPDGYYPRVVDGKKWICEPCDGKCLICKEKGTCLKCLTNFSLHQGECVDSCPEGMISYKGKCISCTDEHCSKCTQQLNVCVECKNNFYLYRGKCLPSCPKGYWINGKLCKECNEGCSDCKGPGDCTDCKTGYFLFNGRCGTYCKDGLWPNCDKRTCDTCNSGCKSCVDNSNVCLCADGFFYFDGKCLKRNECPHSTYPDNDSRQCERCNIEFCYECSGKFTCSKCVKGFSLEGNVCVESKNPVSVFKGPQLFSSRTFKEVRPNEIFSFNKDIIGDFVGSKIISLTFWLKQLKSSLTGQFETILFRTVARKSPPIDAVSFVIIGYEFKKTRCAVKVTNLGGEFTLYNVDCDFQSLSEWTFFYVNLSQKIGKETADLRIQVLQKNAGNLQNFHTVITTKSNFISKDTEIVFNEEERGNAWDIYNFNIHNYKLSEKDVSIDSTTTPPICDYGCEKCKGVCINCNGKLNPLGNGRCPPVFLPIKIGLENFYGGIKYSLVENITKHFSSDNWAFTTWFYIDEITANNVIDLFSIQPTKNTENWKRNQFVKVTINYGVLYINDQEYLQFSVKPNLWYSFVYQREGEQEIVALKPINKQNIVSKKDKLPIKRIYDDLTVYIGVKFTNEKVETNKGFIFQARLYLNGFDQAEHPTNVVLPKNCLHLGLNMKCVECNKDFIFDKKDNCIAENKIIPTIFKPEKFSLWSYKQENIKLAPTILQSDFNLSFWLRKKTHSNPKAPSSKYNLLSFAGKDSSLREKLLHHTEANEEEHILISAINNVGYITTFEARGENEKFNWAINYLNGDYQWDFYSLNFFVKTNQIKLYVKTYDGRSLNFALNFQKKIQFEEISFGDLKGGQMNLEINLVQYWKVVLPEAQIAKLFEIKPRNCSSSCKDCNYNKGICNFCASEKNPKPQQICGNYLIGFSYKIIIGRDTYDKIANVDNWIIRLNNEFSRDVNSDRYSVIGYFKVLDLQSLLYKNKKSIKNKLSYKVFTFGQNFGDPKYIVGNNLLSMNLVVQNGLSKFEFVINQLDKDELFEVPSLRLQEDKWYFIHAGIDVAKREFQYEVFDAVQRNLAARQTIQLKVVPERAQETAELALFGVGRQSSPNDKMINGQFHKFYLSLDESFNNTKIQRYLQVFPIPQPPTCPENCTRCVGVSRNPKENHCIVCNVGFTPNSNHDCEKLLFIPPYNYLVLNRYSLRKNKNIILEDALFRNSKNVKVAFYIRKNYQPQEFSHDREFLHYGGLSVKLVSSDNTDNVIFSMKGVKMTLSLPIKLLNNEWNRIAFNISHNMLTVYIEASGASKEGKFRGTLSFGNYTSWNNAEQISFRTLDYEINLWGIHMYNHVNLSESLIDWPPLKECPYDCSTCLEFSECKQCFSGKLKDNNCENQSISLWNTQVNSKVGVDTIYIRKHLDKEKIYRSNVYALSFLYTVESIKKAPRRSVVRINNLPNSNDANKSGIQYNAFALEYEAPSSFYFIYYNRFLKVSNNSYKEIPIKLKVEPTNNQFYIHINYNGKVKEGEVYIYNSKTSTRIQKFKLEGSSEFLTNNGYIHLGDSNGIDTVFRNILFYYDSNLQKNAVLSLSRDYLHFSQKACIQGSRFKCEKCQLGILSNGQCLVHKNTSNLLLSKEGNTVFLHINQDQSLKHILFPFPPFNDSVSTFSLSFYYRRSEYDRKGHGIVVIPNVVEAFVFDNVLYVNGLVGTKNSLQLKPLYNKTEKYNWIYITITYDIIENEIQVFNIISKSKSKRTDLQISKNENKNKAILGSLIKGAIFGFPSSGNLSSFDITGVSFTPNHKVTNEEIYNFRFKLPRSCTNPCTHNCSDDNICKKIDRIKGQFSFSNIFMNNKDLEEKAVKDPKIINSLPAFRSLSDLGTNLSNSFSIHRYLAAVEIDVDAYYKGKNNAHENQSVLLVISNNEKVSSYKLGDAISSEIIIFGVLSIVENEGILTVYTGSDIFSGEENRVELNLNNRSLKEYKQVYISFLFDADHDIVNLWIYADDIRTHKTIRSPNLPGHIKFTTNFYTHPALRDAHLKIYNPRFYNDYKDNLSKKYGWDNNTSLSHMCNTRSELDKSCSKCAFLRKNQDVVCLKCNRGFMFIQGKCIHSLQNTSKWQNFN